MQSAAKRRDNSQLHFAAFTNFSLMGELIALMPVTALLLQRITLPLPVTLSWPASQTACAPHESTPAPATAVLPSWSTAECRSQTWRSSSAVPQSDEAAQTQGPAGTSLQPAPRRPQGWQREPAQNRTPAESEPVPRHGRQ